MLEGAARLTWHTSFRTGHREMQGVVIELRCFRRACRGQSLVPTACSPASIEGLLRTVDYILYLQPNTKEALRCSRIPQCQYAPNLSDHFAGKGDRWTRRWTLQRRKLPRSRLLYLTAPLSALFPEPALQVHQRSRLPRRVQATLFVGPRGRPVPMQAARGPAPAQPGRTWDLLARFGAADSAPVFTQLSKHSARQPPAQNMRPLPVNTASRRQLCIGRTGKSKLRAASSGRSLAVTEPVAIRTSGRCARIRHAS